MNYEVLFLCKESSFYTNTLYKFFSNKDIPFKMVIDCYKDRDKCIKYDDEELLAAGFRGMMLDGCKDRKNYPIKDPGAWEKAFYYLSQNLKYEYYYFIEEDVYARDFITFIKFFKKLEEYDTDLVSALIESEKSFPGWNFWYNDFMFEEKLKSLNCICRISRKLILEILSYREQHGRFLFQESMFPGVCRAAGLSCIDFLKEASLNDFFFLYDHTTTVEEVPYGKITHSIKSG